MTSNEIEWRNLLRLVGQIVGGSIILGIGIGALLAHVVRD